MKTKIQLISTQIFISLLIISCQRQNSSWNLLLYSSYSELAYDNTSAKLWIFDEREKSLGYIETNQKESNDKTDIPYPVLISPNTILDFCASEDIWIVTDAGSLLLYDVQSQTWIEKLSTTNRVRSCESLNSNTIAIVADKSSVGIVDRDSVDWLSDVPGNIKNLRQDDTGNIWVVSHDCSEDKYIIYKQEGKEGWSEQFRDLGGRLLLAKNDSIWTAGGLVTVFESSTEKDVDVSETLLTQIQIDDLLLDLFSDENHNVWLVTNKNVMLRTAGKNDFNLVSLPASVDLIIDSTFDIKNCLLYISTNIGILYNTNNCKPQ